MSDVPQTELEKQMAELMSGISNVAEGANTAKKSAAKTRRRSRDLEVQLGEMAEGQKDLHSLVRVRRKSKDFDEKELKDIFDEIDTDKTGKLDKTELLKVEDMIKFADKNGDGEVDFEEFHKALTTKPEGAPSAAS